MTEKRMDPVIFFLALGLLVFGVVIVFSASNILALDRHGDAFFFVKRHLFRAVPGLGLMLLISRIDPRQVRKLALPLLLVSIVALALVLVPGIGRQAGGARRWLVLGPFSFQPVEAVKLGVIIFVAHFLAVKGARIQDWNFGFLPLAGFVGVILALILLQPDLGSAVLIAGVVGALMFLGGVRGWHLILCILAGGASLFGTVVFAPWRMQRIAAFWEPFAAAKGAGYQLIQSLLAIARGGLTGLGWGEGKQKLLYLPEPHTDFIYAVVGEELGLIGALCVAAAFVLLLWRGFQISARCRDSFCALLAAGLTLLIVMQGFLNMGVATGLLPTTGIPLPLVSLGGSSLVCTLIALGLLIAIDSMNHRSGKRGRVSHPARRATSGRRARA